jgi:D-tyrosyl-tRNA(Tyr) deacylase
LYAYSRKGNRPSFTRSAKAPISIPLYNKFVSKFEEELGRKVGTGIFGADMKVSMINDGPVTIILDSKEKSF